MSANRRTDEAAAGPLQWTRTDRIHNLFADRRQRQRIAALEYDDEIIAGLAGIKVLITRHIEKPARHLGDDAIADSIAVGLVDLQGW